MADAAIHLGELPAAWAGASLLVTDSRGECGGDPLTGFYVRETRHLSLLRLEIDGDRPWWCERTQPAADRLAWTFVHPELARFGGGGSGSARAEVTTDEHGIPHRSLELRLRYELEPHLLRLRLDLRNRSGRAVRPRVAFVLAADYADLVEAAEARRQVEIAVAATVTDGVLRFRSGHPRLPFVTEVRGRGDGELAPVAGEWASRITLAPRAAAALELEIEAHDPAQPMPANARAARRSALAAWRAQQTEIVVPGNPLAERVLRRAQTDLSALPLLEGEPASWLAPQAGIPLYAALWGRDALTAGWQGALLDRGALLAAALERLGSLQAQTDDPWRDAEPGRIAAQVRSGPLARLGSNPFALYYADFASPLMFVLSLANLYAWTGDRALLARHWATARHVLEWAERDGDRDRDGFLEYATRSPLGIQNQGWKDSGDAIVDGDGTVAAGPIATCELQGYWYAALQLGALVAWTLGERPRARRLWRSAAALKRRFNADFWDEGERCFGLALDGEKRLLTAVTSNVGHCLAAGIVARGRLRAVVERLLAPDMYSGWGVRTLSDRHPAYHPLSYHLGSVWPVENATICFGLRRLGFAAESLRVAEGLFDLAGLYPEARAPECVGGHPRGEQPTPGAYPRANPVQAWNASGMVLVLQTVLGLAPWAPWHLLLVDPLLPSWLPAVELRGLRVGATTASLRFWRDGRGHARVEVLAKDGPLHVLHQPAPEALDVGLGRRLRALFGRTPPAPEGDAPLRR